MSRVQAAESSTSNQCGIIYAAIDYDDNTSLAASALSQYQNVRVIKGYQSFSMFLRPKLATPVYSGLSLNGYGTYNGWLDCAYPNAQHYGVKLAWTTTTTVQTYDVRAMYYLRFKNVR